MTNGLSVSFPVPCKVVIVVKHNVLPSVKRLVMELSSPTPNTRWANFQGCMPPVERLKAPALPIP